MLSGSVLKKREYKRMRIKRQIVIVSIFLIALVFMSDIASAGSEISSGKEVKTGVVTGKIMIKGGGPLSWGQILFYDVSVGTPPMPDKYYRTPDISKNLDGEGKFRVDIPAGKYYLGAVKRLSGDAFGVPQEGDYVYRSLDDKGKLNEFDIKAGSILDIGTISEVAPVRAQDPAKRTVTTAIEGVVSDTEGKPVEDAVVIAFVDLKGKSLFLSDKTNKEGKYTLRLTEGTYYLRVRNRFTVGPPEPGQIVGFYGDGSTPPVRVKEGEIKKGIDFTVILFGGRGPRAVGESPKGESTK